MDINLIVSGFEGFISPGGRSGRVLQRLMDMICTQDWLLEGLHGGKSGRRDCTFVLLAE